MSWKTVTTFVTDLALDDCALNAAAALARSVDAHLDILCLGIDPTQPEVYYAGAQAVALPGAMEEAARNADRLDADVRRKFASVDVRWSVRAVAIPMVGVSATIADAARFSDVVVAGQPYAAGRSTAHVTIIEAALFGGSVPVMVVPDGASLAKFDRIALAWNDSSEALRAARAALPLMRAASLTEIVVIDPPRHGPDRSDPGGRLAQTLARHGVRADILVLARTSRSVADVLARHIADSSCDLLVMGAYGHSRLRESILGGATREMLEHARVAVLMAH